MNIIQIDLARVSDWDSFHDVFAEAMGFPDFYGRNMNAWIDCMTSVDEPDDGLTEIHVEKDSVLVLALLHVESFRSRCPEQYAAIVECSSFVNHRRIEVGEGAVLALSF